MFVVLWELHEPQILCGKLFASYGPGNHEKHTQRLLALSMVKAKKVNVASKLCMLILAYRMSSCNLLLEACSAWFC